MNGNEPLLRPDTWLAGQLGREAFVLSLPRGKVSPAEWKDRIPALLEDCPRPAFCFVKVPTREVEAVRALTAAGFAVVDVNLTLEREPGAVEPKPRSGEGVEVRPFAPEESGPILDIAASCFRFSRFHLDDRIPLARAHAIKRAWVENYTLGRRGEELLAAVHQGRPVGFLAVLAAGEEGKKYRVIDLVGVDPAFQARGAGSAMVNHFCASSEGKCDLVRVGTQAANTPSLRLYQQTGFKAAGSAYVLHAHLGKKP